MSPGPVFLFSLFALYAVVVTYVVASAKEKMTPGSAGFIGFLMAPLVPIIITIFAIIFRKVPLLPVGGGLFLVIFLYSLPTVTFLGTFFAKLSGFSKKKKLIQRKDFFSALFQSFFVMLVTALTMLVVLSWLAM